MAAKLLSKKFLEKLQLSPYLPGLPHSTADGSAEYFILRFWGVLHLHLLVPTMNKNYFNIFMQKCIYIKSLPCWKPVSNPPKWASPMPFYSQGLKTGNPQLHSKAIQLSCHEDSQGVSDLVYYLKSWTTSLYASCFLFLILRSHQALNVQAVLGSELAFLILLPVGGILRSGHAPLLSSETYVTLSPGVHV